MDLANDALCNKTCPDGTSKCGGPFGFFSVYQAASSKPEFITFDLLIDGTDLKIQNINFGGVEVNVYLEIGHDSIPAKQTATPAPAVQDITIPIDALPPGEVLVTSKSTFFLKSSIQKNTTENILVYAIDADNTVTVSSSKTINVAKPSRPLKVSCPIVAEPNVPYQCGFAALAGNSDLSAEFHDHQDNPLAYNTYSPIGN